jgi:hypothetical protein
MKKFLQLVAIIYAISPSTTQAQEAPKAISDSMLKNAATVIYVNDMNVNVESAEKTDIKVHQQYSVLNDEGKKDLLFQEYSNKYRLLDYVEIKVYDAKGKQVGKYKKNDMRTSGYGDGLVDDGFVTYFVIPATSYPVTVDINYEQRLKGSLNIPSFRFIESKQAVLEASYTASIPSGMNLRYRCNNIDLTPVVNDNGKQKTYSWTIKNMAALDDEDQTVDDQDKFPYISVVADQFSYYGHTGDLSSWKSFGSWLNDLYNGLDEIPADRQAYFQNLVKDVPDEKEKIRRLYQYLQENFRYVSIQMGIGGYQPFSAAFTDKNKYGDCKGLSNYMKAILKSVGIKSYIGIINAEYNAVAVDPSFPCNKFNHAILCVPQKKDSIWLECTSSTIEFGTLSTFTENRYALLITENGGVLVPTPVSKSDFNTICTSTEVIMDNDLSGKGQTLISAKGSYHNIITEILKEKRDEQKDYIINGLGFKQPDDFEITSNSSSNNTVQLKLEVSKIPEFNAGNKYFVKPRLNKIWTSRMPSAEKRKMDYFFQFPFEKTDTTVIRLPKGFALEVLPSEKNIKSNYSSYTSKCWYNKEQNSVYTVTKLILLKHRIPASDYASVKSFFDEVLQDDAQRIVINKTE